MPRVIEPAICIRHLDWSESSQVVVLLTEKHGKLRGLAKGSKRLSPSSIARFSGGIELLTRGQIVATVRPTSELATLTEWDMQDDYLHLRQNLHQQNLALYAADLTGAMLEDHDPHPTTYAALQTLLEALRTENGERALGKYQWTLLSDCGYRPQLDHDVNHNEPLPDHKTYTFDPKSGGLTTQRNLADWRVRRSTVELLRQQNWDHADIATVNRANRLMCTYVRALLGRELPTMRYVLGPSD